MLFQKENYPFYIFLLVSALFLAFIPVMKKAFSESSDTYMKSRMQMVQSEILALNLNGDIDFKKYCTSGSVNELAFEALYEVESGVSCFTSKERQALALVTRMNDKTLFCVDSRGFIGEIENISIPQKNGYCINRENYYNASH